MWNEKDVLLNMSFHLLFKMECKLLDNGFVSKYAVLQLPTYFEKMSQFYKILSRPNGNEVLSTHMAIYANVAFYMQLDLSSTCKHLFEVIFDV